MKILIHDYPGHPFQVDLSRALARKGYDVLHYYAGYNVTPRGELNPKKDDPATFNIKPIFIKEPLQKYSFIKRWRQEREYGDLLSGEIIKTKPDIVICANTPLDAQKKALLASQKIGAKFIFWLQDLIGVASHRLLRKKIPILGELVGQYYIGMEKSILKKSDHIVLITKDFQPLMEDWGISASRLSVIPNWAPLKQLPATNKDNSWARDTGLLNSFNFMYTGTLGMKHNPELLLGVAEKFREITDVNVVVISEGPGADWLSNKKEVLDLSNLLIMDYQPFDVLPQVMGTADVLIALLEKDAGMFSVPSKVLSYLCANRPLLLAVPKENLAAKIVDENSAGIVVNPDNKEGFVSGAEKLFVDESMRDRCGNNARNYATKYFNIEKISQQFLTVIEGVSDNPQVPN